MSRRKFKHCEAIVWEPTWAKDQSGVDPRHPLKFGEMVYYLGEIPNVLGHCIVATYDGRVVPMVHPEDFRDAKEEEL
jgi:hypothetical protein